VAETGRGKYVLLGIVRFGNAEVDVGMAEN
jgi:hypothetical protein